MDNEIKRLKEENHILKEQLQNYIPRRRVRRIFKSLKAVLEQDIQSNDKEYLKTLRLFVNKIEKEGKAEAGQEIKTAIEHIIGNYEIKEEN